MGTTSKPEKIQSKSVADSIIEHLDKKKSIILIDGSEGDSDLARGGYSYSFDDKTNILTVVVENLSPSEKISVHKSLVKAHNDEHLFWKASKSELISKYKAYSSSNENAQILIFFKKILKPDDYNALKTSLYMESLAKQGMSIHSFKMGIRERFGLRGANISNLCSANYFEEVFMPLYNDTSQEEFYKYYELAVGEKAIALFVNSGMTVNKIKTEVGLMLEKAKKYRLKEFKIHGKGKINVNNINKFVKSIVPNKDGFIPVKLYEDDKLKVIEYNVVVFNNTESE